VGEPLLSADGLAVRRGRRTILGGVSLALAPGDAVHLAGANGSGKTSLLRVLAGLSRPAAGRLERRAATAYVPERVQLAPALRCAEWLDAMRRLRRLPARAWAEDVESAGLAPAVLGLPAGRASRGMLQRIALVEALASGSDVLLLDEPFSGLDRAGRDWLAAALGRRRETGAAVLFSDHEDAAGSRLAGLGTLSLGR
jgi:heme exporter protein A